MATARPKGKGYEIRVSCGVNINGKKLGKSKTWVPSPGMTLKQIEKELERQKVLLEEQVKNGACPNGSTRFYDFSERWLKEYGEVQLSVKSLARYRTYLQRINEAIGHLKLDEIKPLHLNTFYRNLEEDGISKKIKKDANGKLINGGRLAPKTVLEHHRVISTILATAVKWQIIDTNIALRANPPKVPHREIVFLNEQQTKHLITLLESQPIQYKTMIILLIYSGMRRGELCGLEWKDIDFNSKVLHINRTSQYVGNKTMITKGPKTKSGIRDFSLSATACQLLSNYREWQDNQKEVLGDKWNESDRLFTTWNGLPIHPDTITSWFANFIKKNDFPYVTLHSLRHTNATLMIAEGTDVCTVSKRLGHANTSTTLNIYAHALRSRDIEAASNLENALRL